VRPDGVRWRRRLAWATVGLYVVALGDACATRYHQRGLTGGYDDRRVGPTLFFVKVNGNGFTHETTLVEYFHRRASDLCQSIGFAAYSFETNTAASTTTTPPTYSVDTTYDRRSSHTEIREDPGMSVTKFAVSGYVNCRTPVQQYTAAPLLAPQIEQYQGSAPMVTEAGPPSARPTPMTIADAISACKDVQRDYSTWVGCETNYILGAPSMIMAFRDSKDADTLMGAMATHVAGPFCAAANSVNRAAMVYLVLSGRYARRFSCEMGAWGDWFELNSDDQKQFPAGTQSL
jgi:hypothetical protein